MQLYIIRHCQSENNALWVNTGSGNGRLADPALTATGHEQAKQLAQFLGRPENKNTLPANDHSNRIGFDITHLYSSLMRRSLETSLPISQALNLPLIAREDIHERGGIYLRDPDSEERVGLPGPNRDHFRSHYPGLTLPDSLGEEGWWNRPYEDGEAAVERAKVFWHWLWSTHGETSDRVAMVTHAGFVQSLFHVLFESPLVYKSMGEGREIWIKINNGSITRIDFIEEVIRVNYQNWTNFLPFNLIT